MIWLGIIGKRCTQTRLPPTPSPLSRMLHTSTMYVYRWWDYVLIAVRNCWSWKDGERNHSMESPMDGTPPQSEDQWRLYNQRQSGTLLYEELWNGKGWGSPVHRTPRAVITLTILSWLMCIGLCMHACRRHVLEVHVPQKALCPLVQLW